MYICTRCCQVTEDLSTFTQLHPCGDGYAGESLQSFDCPVCGYEMDKAEKCRICGEVKSAEEKDFYGGICEDCLRDKAKDLDTVISCAKTADTKETVKVDSFLVYMLHPETVNEILWDYFDKCCNSQAFGYLLKGAYTAKAEAWAMSDTSWFGETLEEVMKNEQNGA